MLLVAVVIALLFGSIRRRGDRLRTAGEEVALDTIFAPHLPKSPKCAAPSIVSSWLAITGLMLLAIMAVVPVGLVIAATCMTGSCASVTVLPLVAASRLTRPLVIAVIAFAGGSGLWNGAINAAIDGLGGSKSFASYDVPEGARSLLTLMLMVAARAIPIALAMLRRLPVRLAFAGSAYNPLRGRELWLPIGIAFAAAVACAATFRRCSGSTMRWRARNGLLCLFFHGGHARGGFDQRTGLTQPV